MLRRSMPPSRACVGRRGRWGLMWLDRIFVVTGLCPVLAGEAPPPHKQELVEKTTALWKSEAAGGEWGGQEEVGQEYREVAEGSRTAALYVAGSGSTSAESKIRKIRRDGRSDVAAGRRSE